MKLSLYTFCTSLIAAAEIFGNETNTLPNLSLYYPENWMEPLLVSTDKEAFGNAFDMTPDEDLYLSFAWVNYPKIPITQEFNVSISLNGVTIINAPVDYLNGYSWQSIRDIPIGKLPVGQHVAIATLDSANVVLEENEDDNYITNVFNVRIRPSSVLELKAPETWSDVVVIATATNATNNSQLFANQELYANFGLQNGWTNEVRLNFNLTARVNDQHPFFQTNYFGAGKILSPGEFILFTNLAIGKYPPGVNTLVVNLARAPNDDFSLRYSKDFTNAFEVTSATSGLEFQRPEGWSDPVIVSTMSGTTNNKMAVYTGQPVYVSYAIQNTTEDELPTDIDCSVTIDGKEYNAFSTNYTSLGTLGPGQFIVSSIDIGTLGTYPSRIHSIVVAFSQREMNRSSNAVVKKYTNTVEVIDPLSTVVFSPWMNWSDPIIVSQERDAYYNSLLYPNKNTFVNFSLKNDSVKDVPLDFGYKVEVNDKFVVAETNYTGSVMEAGQYLTVENLLLGKFAPGKHLVRIGIFREGDSRRYIDHVMQLTVESIPEQFPLPIGEIINIPVGENGDQIVYKVPSIHSGLVSWEIEINGSSVISDYFSAHIALNPERINSGMPLLWGTPFTLDFPAQTDWYVGLVQNSIPQQEYEFTTSLKTWGVEQPAFTNLTDETFLSSAVNINAPIDAALVQRDGKIVIGGRFTQVQGVDRRGIARLNLDGSLDLLFNPGAGIFHSSTGPGPTAITLALDTQERILVGGHFEKVWDTPRVSIARLLPNGKIDTAFDPKTGVKMKNNSPFGGSLPDIPGIVQKIVVQPDGKILIGGTFTTVDGSLAYGIARLQTTGLLDSTFDAGSGTLYQSVYDIALQADGKILIAGNFTSVNGVPQNGIARLENNGILDLGFNAPPELQGTQSIAVGSDGEIYAIPSSALGSLPLRILNPADGSLQTHPVEIPIGKNRESSARAISILPDGRILIAGNFLAPIGNRKTCGLVLLDSQKKVDQSLDLGSGFLSPSFGETVDPGMVNTLALHGDNIVVSGNFGLLNGKPVSGIVRLLKPNKVVNGTHVVSLQYSRTGQSLFLSWEGVSGYTYQLQKSHNLQDWQDMGNTTSPSTSGIMYYSVDELLGSGRFFRVKVE